LYAVLERRESYAVNKAAKYPGRIKIAAPVTASKDLLIFGNGHLAFRVLRKLVALRYTVTHKPAPASWQSDLCSPAEKLAMLIDGHDLSQVTMAYVLDDNNERNLELIIALISMRDTLPITAALFNESITPHLEAANSALQQLPMPNSFVC
jgi:hypothetical protein